VSITKRSTVHFNVLAGSTPARVCKGALAALVLIGSLTGVAHAQAYANVTVGGAFAPGVYGQISLGNNPPPPVVNVQPIIVGPPVYGAPVMYLHVPQNEYRDWGRHCARYRACGHPVHFVQVEPSHPWWEQHGEYLRGPGYYREPERNRGEHRGHYKDENPGYRRDFDRDPRNEARRGER
jgi:hypothetical protein